MKNISLKSSQHHPIKRILTSNETGLVACKYILVILVALVGLHNLWLGWTSLSPQNVYKKDFIQEYLLAKAALAGINPYLPCPELAKLFNIPVLNKIVLHPTPHPPPVAVFFVPFSWLTYPHAALIWYILEIACLFLICYLLLRWLSELKGLTLAAFTALLMLIVSAWIPYLFDLAQGQLMIPLVLLLIGAWQTLRSGKGIPGGLLLGLAISLKLIAWPILVFLAIRKNWRATGAAIAMVVSANFGAVLLMGFTRVVDYYSKIGPMIAHIHRAQGSNFSAWTIATRFFKGTGSEVLLGVEAPPLIHAPILAEYFSFVLPLVLLIVSLIFACRARNFDISIGVLICVIILISPVAWAPYLTIALIPLIIALYFLYIMEWPIKESHVFMCIIIIFLISPQPLDSFLYLFATNPLNKNFPELPYSVPFIVGLVTILPAIAIFFLLLLMRRLDNLILIRNTPKNV